MLGVGGDSAAEVVRRRVLAVLRDALGVTLEEADCGDRHSNSASIRSGIGRLAISLSDALGLEVSSSELFAYNSVDECLNSLVARATEGAAALLSVSDRELHLVRGVASYGQQRLWFLTQLQPEASGAYHIVWAQRLLGRLDQSALRRALDALVARHESLRTRFVTVDGMPTQCIDPPQVGFALQASSLADQPDASQRLAQIASAEASAGFDLTTGPLIRGQLIGLGEDQHALLITVHHIIFDGWSMGVLFEELSALYGAYCQGQSDPLLPLPIQYADYALWQRQWLQGERLQRQAQYWQAQLQGVPPQLTLPTDRSRPAVQDYAGAACQVMLDEPLTQGLKALSQAHGTTLFMTLMAAWGALLAGWPVRRRWSSALRWPTAIEQRSKG